MSAVFQRRAERARELQAVRRLAAAIDDTLLEVRAPFSVSYALRTTVRLWLHLLGHSGN